MAATSVSSWDIGLSAWIIQDGNYPDLAIGDIAEFAVEFYQLPGAKVQQTEAPIFVELRNGHEYDVVAEKAFETNEICVIDIGILAYRADDNPFSDVSVGNRFRTQLSLGVDPYYYFEQLSTNESIPPLIYSWRIRSILRVAGPRIEVTPTSGLWAGRKMEIRDPARSGYCAISKTNSWGGDDGLCEYILRCDLLPFPAKRESVTAL
jgi:hypothetical protein